MPHSCGIPAERMPISVPFGTPDPAPPPPARDGERPRRDFVRALAYAGPPLARSSRASGDETVSSKPSKTPLEEPLLGERQRRLPVPDITIHPVGRNATRKPGLLQLRLLR